jgi:hypothetical protein
VGGKMVVKMDEDKDEMEGGMEGEDGTNNKNFF